MIEFPTAKMVFGPYRTGPVQDVSFHSLQAIAGGSMVWRPLAEPTHLTAK
jgi:hypothetical protein